MDPLLQILKSLVDHQIEFVVVGGMAATTHGSPIVTHDVDVCAPLDDENARRIIAALSQWRPKFFERPDLGVVKPDNHNLYNLKNLYLLTDLGRIDFLGEVSGVGSYAEVVRNSDVLELEECRCRVLNLDALIAAKRAAGRNKDKDALRYLEKIKALRDRK